MTSDELFKRLPQVWSVIQSGIERQMHSGCQIYVSYAGETIADCGVGDSYAGQPMTAGTINLWLSAGKPLTAVAILQLWERGLLRLDDRVAEFIPEFAAGGKEPVTLRHVLTHTCGFRNVETGWPEVSWDEVLQRICAAELENDWIIGKTAGYHTSTSWFILGEIIRRLTGRPYAQVMREDLFQPLGMQDTHSALSYDQYLAYGDRIGRIYSREQGELQQLDWHTEHRCASPSPGANTRGPIRELGRFYEMLLNEGRTSTATLLSPQTVAALTARHRVGLFDQTLAHLVDFGLGVIVDSNHYGPETVPYGYSRYCSSRTFGHGGAQSSQGWCDPERGLVVTYFFNGRPGEAQNGRRLRQLNEAIYTDLGLT